MSVGGDGTLLRANALAVRYNLPLLGVNVGRVGFLTEVELDHDEEACVRLANDEYTLETRMMLKATMGDRTDYALNDVVLSRGGYSRLIGVNAWVDGDRVGPFIADGLIVSHAHRLDGLFPVRRRAAGLSGGGVHGAHAHLRAFAPAPAGGHLSRPDHHGAAGWGIQRHGPDGRKPWSFSSGQTLTITKAERAARFIRLGPKSFFQHDSNQAVRMDPLIRSVRAHEICAANCHTGDHRGTEHRDAGGFGRRAAHARISGYTGHRFARHQGAAARQGARAQRRLPFAAAEKGENGLNERLIRMFSETVVSMVSAYNQIIIRTLPASANIAAETIDSLQWPEVLGTAGDNTILMIVHSVEEVRPVLERLNAMIRR